MSRLVQIRPARGTSPDAPQSPLHGPEIVADAIASEAIPGPRVYLETLGCQMNEADSAIIMGQLRAGGYVRVTDPAAADVILLNTCAVREKAEERVYGRTSQLLRHRKDNPGLVFGITGCMAEHLRDKVHQHAPHIGLVAGPDSYRRIAGLVDRARDGERVVDVALDKTETYDGLDGVPEDDGVSGQISIQRGCDKFCTFCVVPFTRGRERGTAPREVLRQVRALVERGYKEVTLLGQTVNSYAWEDSTFAQLLRAVARVDGLERIRFTSPYPVDFTDDVIAAIAEEPKIGKYVHLPVQSGSDAVLARMRRGYTVAEYLAIVGRLRAAVPTIALSTDILSGFSGETDADHAATLELMRAVRFDSAFMFAYSERDLTFAAKKLPDDVAPAVKQRRLTEIVALQDRISAEVFAAQVGRAARVLVHGPSKRNPAELAGRTDDWKTVILPAGVGAVGGFVDVTITRSTQATLFGTPA